MTTGKLFGDRAVVQVELGCLEDPDDHGIPLESVGSWGWWRLWVRGENLSAWASPRADAHDAVVWYLAPLLRWLARSWVPLFNETRLPDPPSAADGRRGASARDIYLNRLESRGDQAGFQPWQDWAGRHALRAAADGAVVPDVFFRRLEDEIEVSWGARAQPGDDGRYFVGEPGLARIPVKDLAEVFAGVLAWGHRTFGDYPWARDLAAVVAPDTARCWFLDGQAEPGRLTRLFDRCGGTIAPALVHGLPVLMPPLDPAVAMFGAVSPRLDEAAVVEMLALIDQARGGAESDRLAPFMAPEPAWLAHSPWDSGYSLAEIFIEDAGLWANGTPPDLDDLLEGLGVRVVDRPLGGRGHRVWPWLAPICGRRLRSIKSISRIVGAAGVSPWLMNCAICCMIAITPGGSAMPAARGRPWPSSSGPMPSRPCS